MQAHVTAQSRTNCSRLDIRTIICVVVNGSVVIDIVWAFEMSIHETYSELSCLLFNILQFRKSAFGSC